MEGFSEYGGNTTYVGNQPIFVVSKPMQYAFQIIEIDNKNIKSNYMISRREMVAQKISSLLNIKGKAFL